MRIEILARRWGGPEGGPDGMAVACAFLAFTLAELGHEVRGYFGDKPAPAWGHPRIAWRHNPALIMPDDWLADLVVSTSQPTWRRTAAAAAEADARGRLVYWHHHSDVPPGYDCLLAAPPVVEGTPDGFVRRAVLPPSSWAVEAGGPRGGEEVLVPGAGVAKGGHVARAVAWRCPDLGWYVLRGRCSGEDLLAWSSIPSATIAPGPMPPATFLGRARAVLAPTRFEVHPLTLVEAAVRGIPVVCSDLPGCRAALRSSARYVPPAAPAEAWQEALRAALGGRPRPLRLRPYRESVSRALEALS